MSKFISATYSENNKTAEYMADDGSRLLRINGSMAWRFQNPGAMESTPFTRGLPGWIGEGLVHNPKAHLFAIFDSYENGREGNRKLLQYRYKDSNMLDVMKAYAVSGDGKNNPEEYAAFIVSETGITDKTKVGEMSDAVLDKVLDAIQKKEGYIPGKEIEVNTTNISVTDGVRPVPGFPFKVTLGTCEYDWKTNEYGDLPPIVHMSEGMNIEIKATNSKGEKETIYSATTGDKSKNIILTKKFTQYKANTLAHTPKVPREKSQPQPIEYVVQSGDVLSKIATRYNVSASELAENNGIKDANKIHPGQKIVIYGKKEPDYVDLSEQVPWEEEGVSYPVPAYSPSDAGTPKAQNTIQKDKAKLSTIGSRNSGNPVAIICHEQKDALWMEVAYREASERWHWGQVREGAGGINYHLETGVNKRTMVGDSNAWCASFINYCLKCACYPITNNANSQYFAKSNKFVKIDSPVYGAIVVLHVPHTEKSGHVTFVYCKTKDGEICVLGGNQGNSVTINPMNRVYIEGLHYEFIGYYVPAYYRERANEIINSGGDLTPVYDNVYEVRQAVRSAMTISDETNTR